MADKRPALQFRGVIGPDLNSSTPHWPELARPTEGSPNVVIVVLDDVGFGHLGCYGSDIDTPTIDRLATGGVRYSRFHTLALCAPTRSCILTGRNHHTNGMGALPGMATGFPGYNAKIPPQNGFLSEVLRDAGYATFAVGKWHLTPSEESSMAGPTDSWPLRRGFDRFYGFLGGETNQWQPGALMQDNHFVEAPKNDGYHLTEDLTERAIGFVRDIYTADPAKPFFMYLAYGACHAPHHAPADEIRRYRGRFDDGWDVARERIMARQKEIGLFDEDVKVPARNPGVKAWSELPEEEKKLYARMQEAFAGFMTHTDRELGKFISFLEQIGQMDNTLFVLVSDNGASPEGGPNGQINEWSALNNVPDTLEDGLAAIDRLGDSSTYPIYPQGWAMAGNTPFRQYKLHVFEGGVADPCIVHWPDGLLAKGEIRSQYHHATDLMPTLLEAIGLEPPSTIAGIAQAPLEGTSMAYSFAQAGTPTRKKVQYYEMLGGRAIWQGGWKAVTTHEPMSDTGDFENDTWELYHVDADPTESRNLAEDHPDILRRLIDQWWVEAGKYNVLPLDDRGWLRILGGPPKRGNTDEIVLFPGAAPLFDGFGLDIDGSFTIRADLGVSKEGDQGVLLAYGTQFGGFSLYVKDGQLTLAYRVGSRPEQRVSAAVDLKAGAMTLGVQFQNHGNRSATARLLMDGEEIARSEINPTAIYISEDGGMTCGRDLGLTVTDDYEGSFPFSGQIDRVVITIDKPSDRAATAPRVFDAVMKQQ